MLKPYYTETYNGEIARKAFDTRLLFGVPYTETEWIKRAREEDESDQKTARIRIEMLQDSH